MVKPTRSVRRTSGFVQVDYPETERVASDRWTGSFQKFKLSEHGDPFGSPSSNAGVIREGRPFRGEYFWNTEIARRAVNGARSFLVMLGIGICEYLAGLGNGLEPD